MNARKLNRLKSEAYRQAYVAAHIDQGLAYQIRALRDDRGWDQKCLAEKLDLKSQSAVARMEDPSYGKLSLATIKKLAKAFDVAVLVKFVPFSRLMTEVENLSEESLCAPSFEKELPLLQSSVETLNLYKIYRSPSANFIATESSIVATKYLQSSPQISATIRTAVRTNQDNMVNTYAS